MSDELNLKKEYKNAIIFCCTSFSERIDQIFEYFLINSASIKNCYETEKNKNKESFLVLKLFNSVYKCSSASETKEAFEKIKQERITPEYLLSDLFSEFTFNQEKKSFSFIFKKSVKNHKQFLPSCARRIIKKYGYMFNCLYTSILSSLVSTYESFLSCIYSSLIHNNYSLYLGSRSVLLQELLSKNIDDILTMQVEEIVNSGMYDSIETTKKILEKEKIDSSDLTDLFDKFNETYQRRNVYIHNGGKVNQQYLSSVKLTSFKNGDYLNCDKDYIKNSISNIQKLIFFISFKILEKETIEEEEIDTILDFYFDRLVLKEYEITQFVYKILSKSKKLDFATKMIAEVNYLITLKNLNSMKAFEEEMSKFDVSAAEKPFKIAKMILLHDYENASLLIEETYNPERTPNELLNWPLYLQFRETDYYKNIVKNHLKDFQTEELSGDDESITGIG